MTRDPFSAIADPTRREIIELLADRPLTINEVSDHFAAVSRQAVRKQLRHLQESGLLVFEKEGREKYCHLHLDNLRVVNDWLRRYEEFWDRKLDRLGDYLDGKKE